MNLGDGLDVNGYTVYMKTAAAENDSWEVSGGSVKILSSNSSESDLYHVAFNLHPDTNYSFSIAVISRALGEGHRGPEISVRTQEGETNHTALLWQQVTSGIPSKSELLNIFTL